MSEFTISPHSVSMPVLGFLAAHNITDGKHREIVYQYATLYMAALRAANNAEGAGLPPLSSFAATMSVFALCNLPTFETLGALQDNLRRAHFYCVTNSLAYIERQKAELAQAKRDARNAKKREQRALKKAAELERKLEEEADAKLLASVQSYNTSAPDAL